jgi:hypothetical protein
MTSVAASIASWLLTSNIVVRAGPHKGAIAGWLTERGDASFAYPEITGYYLSWLASSAEVAGVSDALSASAADAINWFTRIAHGDLPLLTRYHESSQIDDWRNHAVFTFDLSMAARGISDSRGLTPTEIGAEPLRWMLSLLSDACTASRALPVYISARRELPSRWSTQPGPYQLKTAAALLFSVETLPGSLRDAAWNTYDRWRSVSPEVNGPADLHPALYALEGLIEFGRHGDTEAFELAARRFQDISRKLCRWPNEMRSDVIAQTLRLSYLLGSSDNSRTVALRHLLEEFVDPAGRVSFRPFAYRPLHWNAWSAMFTYDSLMADGTKHATDRLDRDSCLQRSGPHRTFLESNR